MNQFNRFYLCSIQPEVDFRNRKLNYSRHFSCQNIASIFFSSNDNAKNRKRKFVIKKISKYLLLGMIPRAVAGSRGAVKSRPHWPLLFIPKVQTSPSRVKATIWAFPKATWTTCWPLSSITWPDQSHWVESFPKRQRSPFFVTIAEVPLFAAT